MLCCLLLVSCVTGRDKLLTQNWPRSLPPLHYFQCSYVSNPVNQRYQSEREYLDWVLNFYQGSLLYPTGWQDVEAAILSVLSPQDRRHQALRLHELGASIAAEWSRDNSVRLIDNRLLSLWGSMLQLAPDEVQLSRYIDVISTDIAGILERELDPADINPRQYEERLQIQLFDDF